MDDDYERALRKLSKKPLSEDAWRWLVTAGFVFAILFILVLKPDPATAIQVVEQAGFSEGVVTESGIITFRCNDSYYYRVRAKNPKGDVTEVTVCCGIFKDCTIRY